MLSLQTLLGNAERPGATMARLRLGEDGILYLSGVLGFATAPLLLELFDSRARRLSRIVVDLGEVLHADSAGLALLLELMRLARRRNQTIAFRSLPEQLTAIARVCNLCRLLPVSLEGLGWNAASTQFTSCEKTKISAAESPGG